MANDPLEDIDFKRYMASTEYTELLRQQMRDLAEDGSKEELAKVESRYIRHMKKSTGYMAAFNKKHPSPSKEDLLPLTDEEIQHIQRYNAERGVEMTPDEIRRMLDEAMDGFEDEKKEA